jgi:hypothetical protein
MCDLARSDMALNGRNIPIASNTPKIGTTLPDQIVSNDVVLAPAYRKSKRSAPSENESKSMLSTSSIPPAKKQKTDASVKLTTPSSITSTSSTSHSRPVFVTNQVIRALHSSKSHKKLSDKIIGDDAENHEIDTKINKDKKRRINPSRYVKSSKKRDTRSSKVIKNKSADKNNVKDVAYTNMNIMDMEVVSKRTDKVMKLFKHVTPPNIV